MPEVVNSRHGGTTLTPNILSALARQGVEVHCWTAKEAHIPAVGGYHGGLESVAPMSVEVDLLRLSVPETVQVTLPKDTRHMEALQ